MANISKWSNVAVAVQSAIGGALTISSITKANPGVATSTSHGLTNGDYVLLSVSGMYQVNNRVFRVTGSTTNTFNLEGEDTTNYGTFSSGSAYKLTFGTTASTLLTISAEGGEVELIDSTTIHDSIRSVVTGVASPVVFSFESIWDVADTFLTTLRAASNAGTARGVLFTFSNGQKVVFSGYVGAVLTPQGSAQEIVKTPVKLTAMGLPTVYSS